MKKLHDYSNKFLFALGVAWESLKSFLLAFAIGIAIVVSATSIIHNVFKIREIYAEDKTGYKNLVSVEKNRMNVNVLGDGPQTIVILSEYAEVSPIIKYSRYSTRLVENFKVVTIEYFGYGYSLSTKVERTSKQIAKEIDEALQGAGVGGPYIFLANGISSLYAYTYNELYADKVESIVVIDGYYPATIKDNLYKKDLEEDITNAKYTFFAEFSGYARILSYVSPEAFKIDQMKDLGFSDEDIKTYRKMIANRYYTGTMRREIAKLEDNMEELENYTYPDYLPVTQIFSTGYIEEMNKLISGKKNKKTIEEYANDLIVNPDIQKVITIDGTRSNLSLDNPDEVVNLFMP